MFADTLLSAERVHLLRVMIWGAASVVAGTAVLVALISRRQSSPLLRAFGAVCVLLGGLELLCAGWRYHRVALRDYAAAVHLDRMIWFELGVCIAGACAGVVVAILAWRLARRFAPVGAGLAVSTHALAVAVLASQLARVLSR
jgi:hypothetical protein